MSGARAWIRCGRRIAVTGATVARQLAAGAGAGTGAPADGPASLSRAFASLAGAHGLSIAVAGEPPRRPCVLVANHLSYLDPIALLALVPAHPICKGEVGRWPLIGQVARSRGVLLVDRASVWSGARVLRAAVAALRAGASVLNFPEGTTTRGDRVLPFRRGIFGAARLAGVPIVPVALTYADPDAPWVGDETFVPHYLRTAAKQRVEVGVSFGPPLWPGRRSAVELAAEARRWIHTSLGRDVTELERSHHHVAAERVRVPETRPDPVLPAAVG
jgi:1-acyl-sn-glycerol-3-phosphate acyltransferase